MDGGGKIEPWPSFGMLMLACTVVLLAPWVRVINGDILPAPERFPTTKTAIKKTTKTAATTAI